MVNGQGLEWAGILVMGTQFGKKTTGTQLEKRESNCDRIGAIQAGDPSCHFGESKARTLNQAPYQNQTADELGCELP